MDPGFRVEVLVGGISGLTELEDWGGIGTP